MYELQGLPYLIPHQTAASPVRIHQLHLSVPQRALHTVRPLLAALRLPPGLLQLPLQLIHTGLQQATLPESQTQHRGQLQ